MLSSCTTAQSDYKLLLKHLLQLLAYILCVRADHCSTCRIAGTCAGPSNGTAGRPASQLLHCQDALGVIKAGSWQQNVVPCCHHCAVDAS